MPEKVIGMFDRMVDDMMTAMPPVMLASLLERTPFLRRRRIRDVSTDLI